MPTYRVETNEGTFEVELDQEPESKEQLHRLVQEALSPSKPARSREEDPDLFTRIGRRYSEIPGRMARIPRAAAGIVTGGEEGRLSALGEFLGGVGAPFELGFAPVGETARSGARAYAESLADDEGQVSVAPGGEGLDIDMEPTRLTPEEYADIGAHGAEFGAAMVPVGRVARGVSRALRRPKRGIPGDESILGVPGEAPTSGPRAGEGTELERVLARGRPAKDFEGPLLVEGPPRELIPRQMQERLATGEQSFKEALAPEPGESAFSFAERIQRVKQATTQRLAERFPLSPKEVRAGESYSAHQLLALEAEAQRVAERLRALADAAIQKPSPSTRLAFHEARQEFEYIDTRVRAAKAEPGRAVQIQKLTKDADQLNRTIAENLQLIDPNDPDFPGQISRFLATIARGAEAGQLDKPAKWGDKIFEFWVNSLLSGPKTHLVNTTSNSLTTMFRPLFETPARAAIDVVESFIKQKPREVFFSESFADLYGMWRGLGQSWNMMKRAWRTQESIYGAAGTGTKLEYTPAIGGTTGRVVRTPGRALVAADEFFKGVNHAGFSAARSFRQAAKEGRKKGFEQLIRRSVEIRKSPEWMAGIEKAARQEAHYRTFTNELGEWGKKLQGLRDQVPGVRYIVPFFRTPTNILKFGMERTPGLGLMIGPGRGALKAGQWREVATKQLAGMGAILSAGLVTHVLGGGITGGGPADPHQRRALRSTGWQPYSIKIGERYYSYNRLEPLGIVLGLAADFVELHDHLDTWDAADKIMLTITQNIFNKSFMDGAINVIRAISDPTRYGERWVQRLAGTIIPTGVAQLQQIADPTVRLPYSEAPFLEGIGQALGARTPGVSGQVLPLRDVWGRPILRDDSLVSRLANPGVSRAELNDPVSQEVRRLSQAGILGIGNPSKAVSDQKLTAAQYDKYVERSGELARYRVEGLVQSRYYVRLSDEERAKAIRKEFEQARRQAREELQRADRDFPQPKRLPSEGIRSDALKEKAMKFWGSKRGRSLIEKTIGKKPGR